MITYEKYTKIRDKKGLKDGDVAKLAGIQPSTFSEWKKGKCTPKYEKMSKIAAALGMEYGAFVGNYGKFARPNLTRRSSHKPSEEEQFDAELCRLYHNATSDAQNSVMTLLKNSQKDGSKSSKEA